MDFVIPKGDPGENGTAATIKIGATTTEAPGTFASVTNTGTEQNAILNFAIPEGAAGKAATITIGTTTTGAPGTQASVTNVGTPQNAILNFVIPQGSPGTTLIAGTTTTTQPGTLATVTNSGTPDAAVFDFTIPGSNQAKCVTPIKKECTGICEVIDKLNELINSLSEAGFFTEDCENK